MMQVHLLYPTREIAGYQGYAMKDDLCKDLNLDLIFRTMSQDNNFDDKVVRNTHSEDPYIYQVSKEVMMISLETAEEICYRQEVVREAIEHPDYIQKLFQLATECQLKLEKNKENSKERRNTVEATTGQLLSQLELLRILLDGLTSLRSYLGEVRQQLSSKALQEFVNRLFVEWDDERFQALTEAIHNLQFAFTGGKMTIQATLGEGMKSTRLHIVEVANLGYRERKKGGSAEAAKNLYLRLFRQNTLVMKEESVCRDAGEMEMACVRHMLDYFQGFIQEGVEFFRHLRYQLAFYQGCSNFYQRLSSWNLALSFPTPTEEPNVLQVEGLFEMSMAILMRKYPIDNTLTAKDKWLYIITGANQGGKSTFLRSVGIAQVMYQAGMFVPARHMTSSIHTNLFSHFTRREDSAMNSGRLDEELKRMNRIMEQMTDDTMLLLNESFATTTEKEGAIIARDITQALYHKKIMILMVTHLFAYAKEMYEQKPKHATFLSAERKEDGTRTFRILEAEPTLTSYGLDLYGQIIGEPQTSAGSPL